MDVLARLDETRGAISVLEHPFYQRWSSGELGAAELGIYAGEYRHAVVALAEASMRAAQKAGPPHAAALREHADEEQAHVELWDDFAHAAGAPAAASDGEGALPQTEDCVSAWTAGGDLLEHLAVLYAIEAGQPEISRTKLEGLTAHYGYSARRTRGRVLQGARAARRRPRPPGARADRGAHGGGCRPAGEG